MRFELDRRPPGRWVEIFRKVASTPGQAAGSPEPHVLDGYIQVDARDDALDNDLADVLLQIDVANRWYDDEMRGAAQPDLSLATAPDEVRLQKARVRAASLTRDFVRARLAKAGAWSPQTLFMPCTPSDADL